MWSFPHSPAVSFGGSAVSFENSAEYFKAIFFLFVEICAILGDPEALVINLESLNYHLIVNQVAKNLTVSLFLSNYVKN